MEYSLSLVRVQRCLATSAPDAYLCAHRKFLDYSSKNTFSSLTEVSLVLKTSIIYSETRSEARGTLQMKMIIKEII